MYRYIIKQENVQASLLIQDLHINFESTKAAGTSPATHNLSMTLKIKMPLDPATVPEELGYIHPQPSQFSKL